MSHRQNVMLKSKEFVDDVTYKAKKMHYRGLSSLVQQLLEEWYKKPSPNPKQTVKEPRQEE